MTSTVLHTNPTPEFPAPIQPQRELEPGTQPDPEIPDNPHDPNIVPDPGIPGITPGSPPDEIPQRQ